MLSYLTKTLAKAALLVLLLSTLNTSFAYTIAFKNLMHQVKMITNCGTGQSEPLGYGSASEYAPCSSQTPSKCQCSVNITDNNKQTTLCESIKITQISASNYDIDLQCNQSYQGNQVNISYAKMNNLILVCIGATECKL